MIFQRLRTTIGLGILILPLLVKANLSGAMFGGATIAAGIAAKISCEKRLCDPPGNVAPEIESQIFSCQLVVSSPPCQVLKRKEKDPSRFRDCQKEAHCPASIDNSSLAGCLIGAYDFGEALVTSPWTLTAFALSEAQHEARYNSPTVYRACVKAETESKAYAAQGKKADEMGSLISAAGPLTVARNCKQRLLEEFPDIYLKYKGNLDQTSYDQILSEVQARIRQVDRAKQSLAKFLKENPDRPWEKLQELVRAYLEEKGDQIECYNPQAAYELMCKTTLAVVSLIGPAGAGAFSKVKSLIKSAKAGSVEGALADGSTLAKAGDITESARVTQYADIDKARRILGRDLSPVEVDALHAAHRIGLGDPGIDGFAAASGKYTPEQNQAKGLRLRRAGFTEGETQKLMKQNVAGITEDGQRTAAYLGQPLGAAPELDSVVSVPRASGGYANGRVIKCTAQHCSVDIVENGVALERKVPLDQVAAPMGPGTRVSIPGAPGELLEGTVVSKVSDKGEVTVQFVNSAGKPESKVIHTRNLSRAPAEGSVATGAPAPAATAPAAPVAGGLTPMSRAERPSVTPAQQRPPTQNQPPSSAPPKTADPASHDILKDYEEWKLAEAARKKASQEKAAKEAQRIAEEARVRDEIEAARRRAAQEVKSRDQVERAKALETPIPLPNDLNLAEAYINWVKKLDLQVPNDAALVLGVRAGASHREIRLRYLELMRQYHPNSYFGNPTQTQAADQISSAIGTAYRTLTERPTGGF